MVFSTNKTDCRNIAEILLKVALYTVKQTTNCNYFITCKLLWLTGKYLCHSYNTSHQATDSQYLLLMAQNVLLSQEVHLVLSKKQIKKIYLHAPLKCTEWTIGAWNKLKEWSNQSNRSFAHFRLDLEIIFYRFLYELLSFITI